MIFISIIMLFSKRILTIAVRSLHGDRLNRKRLNARRFGREKISLRFQMDSVSKTHVNIESISRFNERLPYKNTRSKRRRKKLLGPLNGITVLVS
jgi:hypothetical protein